MLLKIINKAYNVFIYLICVALKKNIKCVNIPYGNIRVDTFLVDCNSEIMIGKNLSLRRNVTIECRRKGHIVIGDNVFFNRDCILTSLDSIIIGNNCLFGPNVKVYDHDHVLKDGVIISGEFKTAPVVIGDNCWVGTGCVILKGVCIGAGSVIGAGCIVTKDIPPNSKVVAKGEIVYL